MLLWQPEIRRIGRPLQLQRAGIAKGRWEVSRTAATNYHRVSQGHQTSEIMAARSHEAGPPDPRHPGLHRFHGKRKRDMPGADELTTQRHTAGKDVGSSRLVILTLPPMSSICAGPLRAIVTREYPPAVLDAWGKPYTAMFRGDIRWYGAFRSCQNTVVKDSLAGANVTFRGKYCLTQLGLSTAPANTLVGEAERPFLQLLPILQPILQNAVRKEPYAIFPLPALSNARAIFAGRRHFIAGHGSGCVFAQRVHRHRCAKLGYHR